MFSEIEEKAIADKCNHLQMVKEGTMTFFELADLKMQKRVNWLKEHLAEMLVKYKDLNPEEQAYRIVFFEYMKINPEHSQIVRVSPKKIMIKSYNFCPYLEACRLLDFDTRHVCQIIEPSIQKMIELINPNLRFSRNYTNVRPHTEDFCEEYLELL